MVDAPGEPQGGLPASRIAGGLHIRACLKTWRLIISQGEPPVFLFLRAHQARHAVVGLLRSLKVTDRKAFDLSIERIRQFLR